jgi:hypothetical protein
MKLPVLPRRAPHRKLHEPRRPAGAFWCGLALCLVITRAGAAEAIEPTPGAIAGAVAHPAAAGTSEPPQAVSDGAAVQLAGNRFEPRYTLGARSLVLNGGGIRSKMIIKIYAMALYLPQPQHDAREVLLSDAPHSIHVVMLREVDAERMAEGFGKAMLDMQDEAGKAALHDRVATLSEAFHRHGDVHRGDALKFEYQPALGTRVSIGGQAICPDIAGADFNVAVLSLWLGEHVADERLKQALMGR